MGTLFLFTLTSKECVLAILHGRMTAANHNAKLTAIQLSVHRVIVFWARILVPAVLNDGPAAVLNVVLVHVE